MPARVVRQRADGRKRLLTVRGEPLADDSRNVVLKRVDVGIGMRPAEKLSVFGSNVFASGSDFGEFEEPRTPRNQEDG